MHHYKYKPNRLLRSLYGPGLIWSVRGKEKTVYLTFDDGPHPDITPEVLNILKREGVGAVFFCVGENVKRYPDVYRRILAEGHRTGNHTFNHLNGWKTSREAYIRNVEKCSEWVDSDLFRPPYGRIRRRQVAGLKSRFRIVMWTALSGDYDAGVDEGQCLKNALNMKGEGSIVVFHDSLKARGTVEKVLPLFIAAARERGYAFGIL
ncbi:MAG: polysaccharide deacetylase family protein [Bacteroidales bacterium]